MSKKWYSLISALVVGCLWAGVCLATPAKNYRIGIVTPTLSASEDEFRGAIRVSQKYPGMIKHISLPENYQEEQETAITQILSLGDQEDIKAIVICAGYSGILPAIQKVKAKRPDLIVITAPIWDDPDMMAKYIDLCLDTNWIKRGITIPEKAKQMGAKTFIHYSFPTHMAKEVLAKRRDMMQETCKRIGIKFVALNTPDPTTGAGATPMLQFLQEDIPRQIAKYGEDTCIFGTNCPMQDVIIAKALELKFIMAEQCCPTPTQGFPAAMNLEITEKEAGDFDKINAMIAEKAAGAGCTGRLSTWPVPVGYFFPEFSAEVAIEMIEGNLQDVSIGSLEPLAQKVAGVSVAFEKMKPELSNYYLIIMDSIFY
jgi:hypothetical protein